MGCCFLDCGESLGCLLVKSMMDTSSSAEVEEKKVKDIKERKQRT
jgi:hypothetical protein